MIPVLYSCHFYLKIQKSCFGIRMRRTPKNSRHQSIQTIWYCLSPIAAHSSKNRTKIAKKKFIQIQNDRRYYYSCSRIDSNTRYRRFRILILQILHHFGFDLLMGQPTELFQTKSAHSTWAIGIFHRNTHLFLVNKWLDSNDKWNFVDRQ